MNSLESDGGYMDGANCRAAAECSKLVSSLQRSAVTGHVRKQGSVFLFTGRLTQCWL